MSQKFYDVIIIGAGASGLMAAMELATAGKNVAILEAASLAGGRILNLTDPDFVAPVELGAEFIHGNLPETLSLLKKAGLKYYKTEGSIWQKEAGDWQQQEDFIEDFEDLDKKVKRLTGDTTIKQFMDEYLSGSKYEELRKTLQQYIEGYYAGDIAKASLKALYKELTTADEENYRIEGGYGPMIEWMVEEAKGHGCTLYFSQTVRGIKFKGEKVVVQTKTEDFEATRVLLTLSVGVLTSGRIQFPASFNTKLNALHQLGFGGVIKIVVQFDTPFWKDLTAKGKSLHDLLFLFSKEEVRTWWTHHPKNDALLTGWISGPAAQRLAGASNEELKEKAVLSLSHIFNTTTQDISNRIRGIHLHNWVSDPHFCGGYSYDVVNGNSLKAIVQEPVENKVFFAGEGLYNGPEIGTVEAALASGKEAAQKMLTTF